MGGKSAAPHILDLVMRWIWEVISTFGLLCLGEL